MSLFLAALGGMGEAGSQLADVNAKAFAEADILREREQADQNKAIAIEAAKQQLKLNRQRAALGTTDATSASGAAGPSGAAGSAPSGVPAADGGGATPAQIGQSVATQLANSEPAAWDLPGIAKRFGIPEQALRNYAAAEDYKSIGDLIAKKAEGKKQIVNGVVVDLDKAPEGLVDGQVFTSSDGKTIMLKKGQDGQTTVVVPQGAIEAQTKQAEVTADVKTRTTPIKYYDDKEKKDKWATEADVIAHSKGQNPIDPASDLPPPKKGVTGTFIGDPANAIEGIMKIPDPQERSNAIAAFNEQARRTPGFATGGNLSAGPSSDDSTKAAADKEYAVQTAKDVVEQRKAIMQADIQAPGNIAKWQRVGKLLQDVDGGKLTPTGFEIASTLNSVGIKVNDKLGNVQAAQAAANEIALQLRSPSGGAGMPGAMSDQDRDFLKSMTPGVETSAAGRKMIIDSYVATQQRNQDVARFARGYEKKYGRLDNGFFDQLQAWSNDHPLFNIK